MIKDGESIDDFFLTKCADWQCVTLASDESDAAATCIEIANEKYKKELKLSPTIEVINLNRSIKQEELLESTYKLYTPDVLANAGFLDLSKKYSKIIGFMKGDELKG